MAMISVDATDGSGSFNARVVEPARTPAGAVVVIQEIFGVNDAMRATAAEIAAMGFVAIVPDLFWRLKPGIDLTDKSEAEWKQAFDYMNRFNQDLGIEDLKATLKVARSFPGANGRVATIGYCLGGRLAFMMATRADADLNISYYGVGIDGLLGELKNVSKPLAGAYRRSRQIRAAGRAGPDRGRGSRQSSCARLRLSECRPCFRARERHALRRPGRNHRKRAQCRGAGRGLGVTGRLPQAGARVGLSRRGFLATAAAVSWAGPGGGGWLETLAGRVNALGGTGLLRSYDVAGNANFDLAHGNCAYVYDNAAAGMALLAGGRVREAGRLGDALLAAHGRDRFWKDGRLRNAYASGPAPASGDYPLPGWWDAGQNRWLEDRYQVGTATGVVAWAMLFWAALTRRTGDRRYHDAANRAGDWIERMVQVPGGFIGGFLGWEPSPERLGWVSTEHNIDLFNAFLALGREPAARKARSLVERMWNKQEGRFNAGLTPAGAVNTHSAADANLWPLLSAAPSPEWSAAFDWVLRRQGVPQDPWGATQQVAPEGIDFDSDCDGIWLEGTAYVALLAGRRGQSALARRMMTTLRAQTAPGGLIWAASVPRLTTGFSTGLTEAADFYYFRRPHIGATAWAALAEQNANPFLAS